MLTLNLFEDNWNLEEASEVLKNSKWTIWEKSWFRDSISPSSEPTNSWSNLVGWSTCAVEGTYTPTLYGNIIFFFLFTMILMEQSYLFLMFDLLILLLCYQFVIAIFVLSYWICFFRYICVVFGIEQFNTPSLWWENRNQILNRRTRNTITMYMTVFLCRCWFLFCFWWESI